MSVRKVKISELPQLPSEAEAGEIFMAATDQKNNKSYRVPLTRYDNALGNANAAMETARVAAREAVAAAENANAAAQEAVVAAENANSVVAGNLAGYGIVGSVASAGSGGQMFQINLTGQNVNEAWTLALKGGILIYNNGRGIPDSLYFHAPQGLTQQELYEFCRYITLTPVNTFKSLAFHITGTVDSPTGTFPFLNAIMDRNGEVELTKTNPLSCIVAGRMVLTGYKEKIGVLYEGDEGPKWELLGGSGGGLTVSDLLNNAEFLNKVADIAANEAMRKSVENVLADNFYLAYKDLTTTEQGVVQASLAGTLTDEQLPTAVRSLMKIFVSTAGATFFGESLGGVSPLNAE